MKRSIPSGHAAVRIVIQKPTYSGTTGQTHSKLDVQTSRLLSSVLKRLHDKHRFSADPFCALAEFKAVPEKAKKQTDS